MASHDARLSKFEADVKQQQGEMTNKIDTVMKAITDRITGELPSNTEQTSIFPLYLFKKLKIGLLEETDHVFGLADGTKSYPVEIMLERNSWTVIYSTNPRLSQVVLGKPFVEMSNMTHDPSEGVVRITNETNEIAYKMPHKIEQYNSLSDLEKEHTKSVYLRNEDDKRRGVEVCNRLRYGVSKDLDMAYWGFLRVGTTFDIFQNILFPYSLNTAYCLLLDTAYWILFSWSLVSAGTDTPYLP
ncbi:hypothetical protein Tco_0099174 [Tanacetum coccineum]